MNEKLELQIPKCKQAKTAEMASNIAIDHNSAPAKIEIEELIGTEEYLAPETILGKEVNYASDLWCLGIILFKFFTGTTPFLGETSQ